MSETLVLAFSQLQDRQQARFRIRPRNVLLLTSKTIDFSGSARVHWHFGTDTFTGLMAYRNFPTIITCRF